MDYREALDYLNSFSDMERGIQKSANPTMSLASMRSLLSRLNNPHMGRRTVHITGSKGKGTTAWMIEGILRQAGARTTLYTSPHLHSYTERIAIGGSAVSPEEFAAALTAIRSAIEDERTSLHGDVSTFGVLTALYFWLTRAQVPAADWQVVEVGLGGTFDATNVFDSPEIAVITPISLEHTAILGSTPAAIARDKVGIVKPGTVCILAPQKEAAVVDVVRDHCAQAGATLIDVAALYLADVEEKREYGQRFRIEGPRGEHWLRTPMLGQHQVTNAMTAVATAEAIRARGVQAITDHDISDGIARTRVRGRMEVMGRQPTVVVDGAHNTESVRALLDTLKDYFRYERALFVFATLSDKNAVLMARMIAPVASQVFCAPVANPRSREAIELAAEFRESGADATIETSIAEAVARARTVATPDDLICVTGSLYAVAEAREAVLGESVRPA